jgi:hypothetical protein
VNLPHAHVCRAGCLVIASSSEVPPARCFQTQRVTVFLVGSPTSKPPNACLAWPRGTNLDLPDASRRRCSSVVIRRRPQPRRGAA